MSAPHALLEVKTSRSAEHTLEQATQWLSGLPRLKNQFWREWLGQDERLSLEIYASRQMVSFGVLVPTRLKNYIQGLIATSFPEALITELEYDPIVQVFESPLGQESSPAVRSAHFTWPQVADWLVKLAPTATSDPLLNLVGTLSQIPATHQAVVQFLVSPHTTQSRAQGRLLVSAPDGKQAKLLLENLKASLEGLTPNGSPGIKVAHAWNPGQTWLSHRVVERRGHWWQWRALPALDLAKLYHFPDKRFAHLPNLTWGKNLLGEPPETLPIVTSELSAEAKREINPFARTLFKGQMTAYGLQRADRRRHLYVIGKTGTGKSTLLANMAINDLKNDEGMCVIDPHGDLVETLLDYIPARRINDVIYFDPADPDRTVKINLFEGENVAHRELIASGIVSIFQKLYAYSWGPRLEYILRNALLTLLKTPSARLSDILDLLNDPKFRDAIVSTLDDPILKNFWVNEYDKLQDKQRTEAIAPILNKVGQFVSSPLIRNVVNAPKSSFSIEDAMNQGKIILVNLSQGRLGEDNATLLGAMLITKIQLAAMARVNIPEDQRKDFYLYVDEFQNFATDSFIKILSEARKYRLNLTLANQYIAQIPETVQKAIFGNCGSIVSFVMGADDAQAFAKEYGDKYTQEDLVSLSRYQILNKISIDNIISNPFPAMTLALAKNRNSNRDKVLRVSRERYATKK